ncbi:MAG TPA: excinuclease ABC subunit UvrB [Fibrobacteraceae bacterium]|nr:excinuclease ABC subunit UvrB [Fibrobacteraceae bacterium]
MPAFRLVSDYAPAGDQPQAIENLCAGMNRGEKFQVLLGVTGSGKTYAMANVIAKANKPALILTHNKTLAAQLYQEFKAFFPDNAVEYFVSYYDYYQPEAYVVQTDTFIEKDASINDEIEKLRLRATANLLTRRDTLIVASVSCIYGLGSPETFRDLSVRLHVGETRDRDDLLRALVKIQYDRNDFSLDRGCFRVRGDVVEVHPSYDDTGLRIELFGDEVERLTRFHLITGETIEVLDDLLIAPAKHFVTRDDSRKRIVRQIADELQDRVHWFETQNKLVEAQRIQSRTRYDMEMILETGICSGIENYSRIVEDRPPGSRPFTLLDYFGDDWLLFIDESHVSVPQVGGMHEGDRSRKTTLVEYGWRLPCAIDNRPMKFAEFEAIMPPHVVFVSATPGDYELKKSGGSVVELINRPTGLLDPSITVHPVQGQMDHLLAAIEATVQRGERVLVTTLTKKMSQDLTDYFQGLGIRAQYLHSEIGTLERHQLIKGLRLGEFDVLVGINLLREGLDLPEVSLVTILDADKEGFLRNYRSLIQTMGRASRNVNGQVILYADHVTDSMAKAMAETERRRNTQIAFNTAHGITPRSVKRRIEEDLRDRDPLADLVEESKIAGGSATPVDDSTDNETDESKLSSEELEARMMEAASKLDFEEAARLRDVLRKRG